MAVSKEKASKKQQVGVLIDIGNSETRVRLRYKPTVGIAGVQEPLNITFALSNHYFGLLSAYSVSQDYMNSDTVLLDIGGVRVAHGELVEREFVGSYEKPAGKHDKSKEPITNWTIQLVLLKAYKLLAEHWDVAVNSIDVAFNIYCLLPPEEHAYNKEGIIKLIEGIDKVTEYVPNAETEEYTKTSYPVVCNTIQAFPEGISAFFGVRVDIQGNKLIPNKLMEKYMKGYVLIIDIGAGTTDLAIMQDGQLKADSRISIPDAGNHIISSLYRELKRSDKFRNNLPLGLTNIESVMSSAFVSEGDGLIEGDCVKELDFAKEEVASSLSAAIKNYANSLSVMAMVKGILVIGGANVEARRDGALVSPSLGSFLIPKIRIFAPHAELIDVPNRDTRYLNLDGLETIYITQQSKGV